MGKNGIWAILCFWPLPPLNNVEKQRAKLVSIYVTGSQHCIGGRGGISNTLLKIPIIFCHLLSEIYQKKGKKDEVACMLFQITQICFDESDYVTLHRH